MHKMTFQFGSDFEANQRVDPWFERAMDNVRNALAGAPPALVPVRTIRRLPNRLEARLRTLSR